MKKILIVGGKLQGTEVAYLSKKAGYETILVDKNKEVPAGGLVDHFVQANVFEEEIMLQLFQKVDVVMPAIEDDAVLIKLDEYGAITQKPVIIDIKNYQISSSKLLSNQLFKELGLPVPGEFPHVQYPIIIKPDDLSGSSNVFKVFTAEEASQIIEKIKGKPVIQEFLEGRSYSLEVIGDGDEYYFSQITEIIIDQNYDCKRVIAPADIEANLEEQFYQLATELANTLKIKGIFDIEVIDHHGTLKLIEIDARFPSQTPIAVYMSCGMNLVEGLVESRIGSFKAPLKTKNDICFYQQVEVNPSCILVTGEHTIGNCKNLKCIQGFFGADEALTDYVEGAKNWKAIVMVTGDTVDDADQRFEAFIDQIKLQFDGAEYIEG